MPPRKRPGATEGAPPPAAKAAAGACEHVVANADLAVMPKQPTDGGRTNLCWVSPVVAVAAYYQAAVAGHAAVTVESVLALQGGAGADEAASAEDILWEEYRIGTVACLQRGEDWDPWDAEGDADVWCNGLDEDWRALRPDSGMLVDDWGTEKVSEEWFGALRRCIDAEHVALLLVERLEAREAQAHAKAAGPAPPTGAGAAATAPAAAAPARCQRPVHYLLVLGYRVQGGRRGSKNYRLVLKDPMEADRLVTTANLEAAADGKMVLATTREDGGVLDRFRPLQCCHFSYHGPKISPARCSPPQHGACDA